MQQTIRVGILGDFNEEFKSHWATTDSIKHSAKELGVHADRVWIPTPTLLTAAGIAEMERCDRLWASPGSPYVLRGCCAGSSLRAPGTGRLWRLEEGSNMLC